MFTGIVTDVGVVRQATAAANGVAMEIASRFTDLVPGESIAVDGACLTVERVVRGGFTVQVVPTSVARTNFGRYLAGRQVNLERALRAGDRLGGHMVQGHVDGVATVVAVIDREGTRLVDLAVPPEVHAVSVPLGSITVDGVSLTVNDLRRPVLVQVSLIPFTLQQTTLGERKAGDLVHVEGDLIGKHVRQQGRGNREEA